jgi:hypothetical protein
MEMGLEKVLAGKLRGCCDAELSACEGLCKDAGAVRPIKPRA